MRKLALIFVVLAGACGALLLGGQASGQTTGVTVEAAANDTKFLVAARATRIPDTIVLAGSTVAFTHAAGPYPHNVDFTGGPQPTSCTQADPPGGGAVPPLPAAPSGAAWSGTCTFADGRTL